MFLISFIFNLIIHINVFFTQLKERFFISQQPHYFTQADPDIAKPIIKTYCRRKTPEHAIKYIIYLKAIMPHCGCRKIAEAFDRTNKFGMTISKSTAYKIFIIYKHEIYAQRKEIRSRKPKATPKNVTWSLDLTTITCDKLQNTVMGVIDNGTRANLLLKGITNKSSIMLLKQLIAIIELYGKPKKLRMDNEANFTSRTFRLGLFLLGIKPEYTEVACPWMNGRIERLFGTLKEHIRKIVLTQDTVAQRLIEFRYLTMNMDVQVSRAQDAQERPITFALIQT